MNDKVTGFADAVLRLALRLVPILPAPEVYDLIRTVRRSQDDVDKQVQEAVDALSRSSALIDHLGKTLCEREARLKELQTEYSRVSQLASLTAQQGEAVAKSLEAVLGRSQARERTVSFLINIVAGLAIFIVGVFGSDWVKSLPTRFSGNSNSSAQPDSKK
jgi:hypothetical protein